ncbi:uncharacterized protein L3040_006055 [Drepanopeziza brunnea f. sp. 'multigermtubi']|uniref:uncharacterized protein n=1 Tax=Drepanopeziza brunnea f. sp. 'multigermtubi' TaxID=698441 RepID=UPI0023A03F0A|nr:hypothetical protein L3040_006055 [Drepanopeziza brunnea f. sp. 'multigermtubi']
MPKRSPSIVVSNLHESDFFAMRLQSDLKAGLWLSPTKRATRCLSLALILVVIIVLGLTYEQQTYPYQTELHGTVGGLHMYGSSPEEGSPKLPYLEIAKRDESSYYDRS